MSEKKFEPRSQSQSDAATESFTARARDTQPEARRESGSETEGDSRTYRHSQSEVKLESQSLRDISQGQRQKAVWTSCCSIGLHAVTMLAQVSASNLHSVHEGCNC